MRHAGGMKIRALRPFLDDGVYKSKCPTKKCNYIMSEREIHDCYDRSYVFAVDE